MADRLTPLLTFARIVEAGSLSAAARSLERSLPAVCRSLAQLEQRLGQRLLERTTRRIALTEAGADFYERCRRIAADLEEAEAAVTSRRRDPQGRLRISAPVLFGRLHVAGVVSRLLEAHAKVSASLLLTDRNVNLVEDGIDVAVRIGELPDSSLVARSLGSVARIVCGAPSYLRARGTPKSPADLARHDCIRFSGLQSSNEWLFLVEGRERRVPAAGRFESNDGATALQMAEAGLGLVAPLAYQAAASLRRGALVRILKKYETRPLPVNAVYPSGRLASAALRTFLEMLEDSLNPILART